ncbi:flagellar basal body-associated FliL family protein [Rubinisphaera margarita]|uniref:flagellar basal body-associated FliL family protein n=1 Tax=Rubinisphaera margarita TaxID=2909586 RepID=UPI001EE89823|nr:flagellar basal body-associated FliL family protein [Rubinisphaera margarita]MCG6154216.1 hypothetical protein [Rubinisphaera margarita]
MKSFVLSNETIERLREIHRAVQQEQLRPQLRFAFSTDNLILLGMITVLVVIALLMLSFVHPQTAASQDQMDQDRREIVEAYQDDQFFEISLGEAESMVPSVHAPDSVDVINYEAVLTIQGTVKDYMAADTSIRQRENRIRAEVGAVINSASPEKIAEPSLSQLRTEIRVAVNSIIGEEKINEVNFSHFTRYTLRSSAHSGD